MLEKNTRLDEYLDTGNRRIIWPNGITQVLIQKMMNINAPTYIALFVLTFLSYDRTT